MPLGTFLDTNAWAELTNRPGLFKSIKFYKNGLEDEITEEEAIAISEAWDPVNAMAYEEPEAPKTVQRKRTFTTASQAESS